MENEQKQQEELTEQTEETAEQTAETESESVQEKLTQAEQLYEQTVDQMKRLAAEYDNFRKRSIKERSQIKLDTLADTVEALLPVADNLQRALDNAGDDESPLATGVQMVMRQLQETFTKLGVEEIEGVGAQFDPEVHNAVMHVDDETLGENVIVEELQKGYRVENKVIRHSMVKVAN